MIALIRFGSNVSFTVFGCTIGFTVIHGYCLWKPASAFANTGASSPPNRCHSVMVTGVCDPDEPPELAALPPLPPQAAVASATATTPSRRPSRLNLPDAFLIPPSPS